MGQIGLGFTPVLSNPPPNPDWIIPITLTSAGRVGFYIDYSELSATGTHTFYVHRTHGSTGFVGVDYLTAGDSHTVESGTIFFGDGEAGIKSFTVEVPTKTDDGDHRIHATLSNPTGGLVLHNGTKTIAYGIIDDGTIASDSDAVFFNEDALTNGTGTQASPYDNVYDAISNVGVRRYIYGRGTITPDGTNTDNLAGATTIDLIAVPATRADESARGYIQAWPGFTLSVDGGVATDKGGFYADSGESYWTFRNIDFSSIDASAGSNGFGIFFRYGGSESINVEHCTADDINGAAGGNNGAYMLWGVDGGKVWRSTSNNIQTNGDNTNQNTAGAYTYDGKNLSVQRCRFSNSYNSLYHKRVDNNLDATTQFSFNHCQTSLGAAYGTSDGAGEVHSYGIVQGNAFVGCNLGGVSHLPGGSPSGFGDKSLYITNNVFYQCGSGEIAAIHCTRVNEMIAFGNIMLDCRKVWGDVVDSSANITLSVEYADYNNESGTTLTSQRYEHQGVNYSTAAALNAAEGLAGNDTQHDPQFVDAANGDFRLSGGSSCIGASLGGFDQGIYLTGNEIVGP